MRTTTILLLVAVLAALTVAHSASAAEVCEPKPGPVVLDNEDECFPNPEECSSGDYNGVYDAGLERGRMAFCVGYEGHVIVYVGGNLANSCGAVVAADRVIAKSLEADPNECA